MILFGSFAATIESAQCIEEAFQGKLATRQEASAPVAQGSDLAKQFDPTLSAAVSSTFFADFDPRTVAVMIHPKDEIDPARYRPRLERLWGSIAELLVSVRPHDGLTSGPAEGA